MLVTMKRRCWHLRCLLCVSVVVLVVFILFRSSSVSDLLLWRYVSKKYVRPTTVFSALSKRFPVAYRDQAIQNMSLDAHSTMNGTKVVLAITLCGHDPKQEEQILVMLKSAIITSPGTNFEVVIVADSEDSYVKISKEIESWPLFAFSSLSLTYVSLWYPKGKEWMKTFRTLCTTERLYYPVVLSSYDAVIHVDTDVLFLRPVQELWNFFFMMNSQHFIAMAPEHLDPENAYYNSALNKIPFYGPLGLNAGVMLMNLTRMRTERISWISSIHRIYKSYQHAPLHFADQDILNIFFHYYPVYLLALPCNWNYRNDFCRFRANTCFAASSEDGIALLHGNRGVFLSADEPAFNAVYNTFLKYNWSTDLTHSLLDPLQQELSKTRNTLCGSDPFAVSYTKYLKQHFAGV